MSKPASEILSTKMSDAAVLWMVVVEDLHIQLNRTTADGLELESNVENLRNVVHYYMQGEQDSPQKEFLSDMHQLLGLLRLDIRDQEMFLPHGSPKEWFEGCEQLDLRSPKHPCKDLMISEMQQASRFLADHSGLSGIWPWFQRQLNRSLHSFGA